MEIFLPPPLLYAAGLAATIAPVLFLATDRARLPLLASFVAASSVMLLRFDGDVLALVKTMCELPLGLGSLVLYPLLPSAWQRRYQMPFTAYINFAVLGNIAMMIFTPGGSTMRAWGCRFACASLSLWLWKQVRALTCSRNDQDVLKHPRCPHAVGKRPCSNTVCLFSTLSRWTGFLPTQFIGQR
ncbi:hypothetical protein HDU84_000110 [Entophlyctis sp. JEL0112]|nr:hypothetical protein HDU84_000110 [Entophlyctis sp. JEL0112]